MGNFFFRRIETLFLWSSGANLEVLDQVPTEKSKYFGIGGTIVFTALMASFAGGYGFFTAFKSLELAIPFGIFWGCLIFNLDRYIVASFGVGDGKKTISKQEVIEAFPRLLMAIILGFVISTPLELKLFEKEINAKIDTDISLVQKKIIRSATEDVQIKSLNQEKSKLEKDNLTRQNIIDSKKTFWEQSEKDKNDEWNTGKFSGKVGKGGYYTDLLEKAKNAGVDYQKIDSQYSALNITDFISSIKLSLEDLENTGRRGYIEGISNIILKKLNKLGHYDRPIHCSDQNREVLYIKNDNQWIKETEEKPILTKAIKTIANENIKQIKAWREQNPDCTDSDSKKNSLYLKIVSNSMSGSDKEECDKNLNRIISNVAKKTIIPKEI
jgi:hypothetical protein